MLLSISALSLAMVPVVSSPEVYGPRMDKLHIKNYGDPYKEFAALEAGEIDIVDWPMTKTWVDKFAANPNIVLASYAEVGSFEYDIYNQRWPTGCDGIAPHKRQRPETGAGDGKPPTPGADWDPETESWKVYFDPDCPHCQRAWMFRLALAYLTDKEYVRTEILKGYGNMMPTWLTYPQLGWADMDNLTATSFVTPMGNIKISSLIYTHDVDKGKQILNAAGFTLGPDGKTRIDPRTGTYLEPLIFYIRLDDPNRKAAGEKLAADLRAIGVPVDARVVEKTVCFKSVMVEYNYNLYTGGYSYGADPWEIIQGLFHSNQYWAPVGWSGGYQGFCNIDNDRYADMVKKGATYEEIVEGSHGATFVMNKYVNSIPLWSSAGVHGYRKGWTGVVNHEGYGLTWGTGGVNYWSLMNMYQPGRDTVNLGFKSNSEALSVVTSEWVWDWIVLDAIYDTLLCRNPYNLAKDYGLLATEWHTGMWDTDKIYVNFTLRQGAKWHDGTLVTPEDVKWGLEFIRDCGPGVAWNYMMAADIDHVDTWDKGVVVYFKTGTYWAVHLAGFLEFPSRKIWMAASEAIGFGYDPATHTFKDRMKVREYHPWEQDVYNAATGGVGADGIIDLTQDGTGEWIYVGADPLLMEWYDLKANRDYYLGQDEVSSYLAGAFRDVGDANRDRVVDIGDMNVIARALGTEETWPHGTGWGQYNPDADLNNDGKVDALDMGMAGRSYGKSAG